MLEWQYLWVLLLLPLPILVYLLGGKDQVSSTAIRVPFFKLLTTEKMAKHVSATPWRSILSFTFVWFFLLLASARPVWVGEPIALPQEGRDMLIAVDLSESMLQEDMQIGSRTISRIDAVKAVVSEFIAERSGDRAGLLVFGEYAYIQTPLTFDLNSVSSQLLESVPGIAGRKTAIGTAIGLSVKTLRERPDDSRVLILLTDGRATAGVDPIKASTIAAEAGIKIHTIGVGADSRGFMGFGGSDLDEATLQTIANNTGGQYFRARNPQQLASIYQRIDELEPIPEERTFRPKKDLFYLPLSMALLCLSLWILGFCLWPRVTSRLMT